MGIIYKWGIVMFREMYIFLLQRNNYFGYFNFVIYICEGVLLRI